MKRVRVVAAIVVLVLTVPGVAWAAWSATANGDGRARADGVATGSTPTVSVNVRTVTVSWTATTLNGGAPVTGYLVNRYANGSSTPETIGSACAGTITALTCTESLVPGGNWRYRITPVRAAWRGAEGPQSALATVVAPSFTFSSNATLTSLPAVKAGSLAQFGPGETVQFRLDAANGTLLTGSTTPATIGAAGTATTSTTIPAGTTDGVHTVYAVGSLGTQATATVTIDRTGPVATTAVIQKSTGGTPSFLRQGGTYRIYANVADAVSTVNTVTANVTTVTTAGTAVALTTTGGPWTVGGVSYAYRSAQQTANGTLTAGAKAFTVTAADNLGNAATTSGFSVTIDNTAPTATAIATADGGGTAGRAQTGDSITFTFSEPIDPNSILANWDGTATSVTLRLQHNGGGDRVTIRNAANTAALPFGTVDLGGTNYTTTTINFTGSTMTMSGTTITVVLGTPSGTPATQATATTMTWTPAAGATDRAGGACSTTALVEAAPADVEF